MVCNCLLDWLDLDSLILLHIFISFLMFILYSFSGKVKYSVNTTQILKKPHVTVHFILLGNTGFTLCNVHLMS